MKKDSMNDNDIYLIYNLTFENIQDNQLKLSAFLEQDNSKF